ncbi:hypothetical protein ETB97_004564 [Aspergillus alliaceus]|uniref:Uncharacterized protein n=1 Tax=Petromyces alliaceus TaxID=209559 RepID=A0A8H6A2S3_PETAA|nr:hypothetical protein ETB97_004564 [Aspergillus burnettii]
MARLPLLLLTCFALTLLSCANAWTLVWRNDTGAEVVTGNSPRNCTPIYHQKGSEFSFDPEGKFCLQFWKEATCIRSAGVTCEGWKWKQFASQPLLAFNVYDMPPSSVSAYGVGGGDKTRSSMSSTAATTSSTIPAATSVDPTGTAQSGNSNNSGSSLSGGAIAGIVIGVVAGFAIVAASFFFWGRRKRNAASSTPAPGLHEANLPEAADASKPDTNTSETMTQVSSVPPSTGYTPSMPNVVELPGEKAGAELSNSRQLVEMGSRPLVEMDGQSQVKRP